MRLRLSCRVLICRATRCDDDGGDAAAAEARAAAVQCMTAASVAQRSSSWAASILRWDMEACRWGRRAAAAAEGVSEGEE